MNIFHINHLLSDGLITNYSCSPSRPKDDIDKNRAEKWFKKAKALGLDVLPNCLVNNGIKGLYKYAKDNINYKPIRKAYRLKCDLCNEIRMSLYQQGLGNNELKPDGYYKEI